MLLLSILLLFKYAGLFGNEWIIEIKKGIWVWELSDFIKIISVDLNYSMLYLGY